MFNGITLVKSFILTMCNSNEKPETESLHSSGSITSKCEMLLLSTCHSMLHYPAMALCEFTGTLYLQKYSNKIK